MVAEVIHDVYDMCVVVEDKDILCNECEGIHFIVKCEAALGHESDVAHKKTVVVSCKIEYSINGWAGTRVVYSFLSTHVSKGMSSE